MEASDSYCTKSIDQTSSVLSKSSSIAYTLFIVGLEPPSSAALTLHASQLSPAPFLLCYQVQISWEADMQPPHNHSVYSCFELCNMGTSTLLYTYDIQVAMPNCISSFLSGGYGGPYDCEPEYLWTLDVSQADTPRYEALDVQLCNEEKVFKQPSVFVQLAKTPISLQEVSAHVRALIEHVNLGLNAGYSPELAVEGTGGVYFMKDEDGTQNLAVFKPMDEEPMAVNNPRGYTSSYMGGEGLRKGIRAGTGAFREVAAYILDHPSSTELRCQTEKGYRKEGFAGVPATVLVRCFHEAFNHNCTHSKENKKAKLGSLQQFVHSFASCEDVGTSYFSVEEVHKITVLDLRLANTDRHAGNILLCREEDGSLKLVPVDHGYCLPEKFGDCTFEWLYWPQASQPYGPSTLKYIESLDAELDIKLLQQCSGWESMQPTCGWVLRIATMLLKKGAAAGLTPFQIGCIMSCSKSMESKTPIEALVEQAEEAMGSSTDCTSLLDCVATLLDDYINVRVKEGVVEVP